MMQSPNFKYTDNKATILTIPVGIGDFVQVVGDPENASYEWTISTPNGVREHSDNGYGIPEVALRDGLIAYFGMPD